MFRAGYVIIYTKLTPNVYFSHKAQVPIPKETLVHGYTPDSLSGNEMTDKLSSSKTYTHFFISFNIVGINALGILSV
jgi:hypothetical protein